MSSHQPNAQARQHKPEAQARGPTFLVGAFITLLSLAGCASSRLSLPKISPPGDVSPQRAERHQAAIQVFEQHRDQAQLQAALDRWQQNDLGGCESRLRTLVTRRPDFVEARLRLAELAWSCEDPVEAETQYRAAVALAPDRADIHHALGLVLQSLGRADEAGVALARASELAPDDELFRLAANRPLP